LHCHIADGPDADRVDFRYVVEDEIRRYNDLTFTYLDACKPTPPYHFVQCAHCQAVRSSQFAIYRVTPQTDAETYIAIGMSIALETQFGYEIPKIFFTADVHEVPSLLSGYEVIEAVNTKGRKQRLRKALPVVMQRVQECAWSPRVLPFEVTLPIVRSFPVREESEVVVGLNLPASSPEPLVFYKQLKLERELRGWSQADLAEKLGLENLKTIRRWERGESLPQPYYRKKLYEIFGKSPEELGLVGLQSSEEQSDEALNNPVNGADLESYSGLQLEPSSRRVWIDGSPLSEPLSIRQFKLLQFLAEHAGEVCPREETSEAVYEERSHISHNDAALLDALIERTRLHIGDDVRNPRFIETVGGVGYRLNGYIGERS
jgi:transcriptional regulator with XRE-family HTH domain